MATAKRKPAAVVEAANEPVQPPKKALTTAQMIDRMYKLREEKRVLAAKLKPIEEEYDQLEKDLKAALIERGSEGDKTKLASASLSEEVVGNIKDWDSFTAYIKKSGHFHLLQRRISNPAFRELSALLVKKGGVPGVEAFTKINLTLTSLTPKEK